MANAVLTPVQTLYIVSNDFCACSEPSLVRQIFLTLEQLKMQNTEMKVQLQNNTTLIQLLVGRNDGSHEADIALPEDIQLPCTTIDSLQLVEARIADNAVRKSLVRSYGPAVIYLNFF